MEEGGILTQEECAREGNWTGGTSSSNNTEPTIVPYLPTPVSNTLPLGSTCTTIVTNKAATLSPTNLPHVAKRVVTLRSPSIYKMAAAFLLLAQDLVSAQHSLPSTSPTTVSAASRTAFSKVTILDIGATHHL